MKVLELFSGTGSVSKICKEKGWEVVSLDLKGADINTNILDWDYTQYQEGHFDIIWASPPCRTFSSMRQTHIGRKLKCHGGEICSMELILKDIDEIGLPILRQTEKIIDYLKPKYYFIENPQTGLMKKYIDRPFYDVDYCKYSDWGYKKPTRVWTNLKDFVPKKCKKDCGMIENGKHKINFFGWNKMVKDGDKVVKVITKEDRIKYHSFKNIQPEGSGNKLEEKYRIPPLLITELFDKI